MPRLFIIGLRPEDRISLEEITLRSANWRQRERAQTLLLLDEGIKPAIVAQRIGINPRTVAITRKYWFKEGFPSLLDSPRSGAPRKITPEQIAKIVASATAEPLTAKQLLALHVEHGGAVVHLSTISAALKASDMVWKRTRHSLKKTE